MLAQKYLRENGKKITDKQRGKIGIKGFGIFPNSSILFY